ncbi:MAG: AAA family ATPase [Gemmatimonadota bacterium]|nr:AAA family ATPase [Gemmatimonadota bacterium]
MQTRNVDVPGSKEGHFSPGSDYNLNLARHYMVNILCVAMANRSVRSELIEWTERQKSFLESLGVRCVLRDGYKKKSVLRNIKRAIRALKFEIRRRKSLEPEANATRLVIERFSLGAAAAALLELAYSYTHCFVVEEIWENVSNASFRPIDELSLLLRLPCHRIESGLRELARSGISDWEIGTGPNKYLDRDNLIHDWFHEVWHPPVRDMAELTSRLVGEPCSAQLGSDDFAHVVERDAVQRVMNAAMSKRHAGTQVTGVNILLVGRAGTGKTEFAKTVASASGTTLFSVGEIRSGDEESCNDTRDRRADFRNELRMAQTLLKSMPAAAILCDEAEDALESDAGSRLSNHRLLEDNPVPVIYTMNSLKDLDESMLRRFSLVVRFNAHGPSRQTAILRRMLTESGIDGIDAFSCARRLVDELECTPGILAKAIETSRLVGGTEADVYRYCEQLERTVTTQYARPRLGQPVPAELPWEAFSHLERDAEDARKTLASATHNKKKGINILLYGPPGTGKTEFARTLCGEVGTRLYSVGANEVGPKSRRTVSRTDALEYALEALADEPGAVVFFDEMEDFESLEKHWLNRILEENPVPIIWACNSIEYYRVFQPFFIDRMIHAIEFRQMSGHARKRMFTDILTREHIPDAEARRLAVELAQEKTVTPRQLAMATRQAAMVNGDVETIRRNIAQKAKLRHGVCAPDSKRIAKYDPALVHADVEMQALTERITSMSARRFAMCLCGPPGTGKTAYVGYVAERLGMDLLPRRASDLLSKWVGQTEQQIAAAFAEAVATQSFLVFDEVDSLLMDRELAVRSWETSMVNELLSQMERHPLPFACTTNRREALDPAAARRFLFRVEFFYMDRKRVERAFGFFYGCEAPPEALALDKLTPADFANVRERAKILKFLDDPERIANALAEECRAKPGGGRMGFR